MEKKEEQDTFSDNPCFGEEGTKQKTQTKKEKQENPTETKIAVTKKNKKRPGLNYKLNDLKNLSELVNWKRHKKHQEENKKESKENTDQSSSNQKWTDRVNKSKEESKKGDVIKGSKKKDTKVEEERESMHVEDNLRAQKIVQKPGKKVKKTQRKLKEKEVLKTSGSKTDNEEGKTQSQLLRRDNKESVEMRVDGSDTDPNVLRETITSPDLKKKGGKSKQVKALRNRGKMQKKDNGESIEIKTGTDEKRNVKRLRSKEKVSLQKADRTTIGFDVEPDKIHKKRKRELSKETFTRKYEGEFTKGIERVFKERQRQTTEKPSDRESKIGNVESVLHSDRKNVPITSEWKGEESTQIEGSRKVVHKRNAGRLRTGTEKVTIKKSLLKRGITQEAYESNDGKSTRKKKHFDKSKDKLKEIQPDLKIVIETDYSDSEENINRERVSSPKSKVKVKSQKKEGDVEERKQTKRNRKNRKKVKEKHTQGPDVKLEEMDMKKKLGYIKERVFRKIKTEGDSKNTDTDISTFEEEKMQSDDKAKTEASDINIDVELIEDETRHILKGKSGKSAAEGIFDIQKEKTAEEEGGENQELEGNIEQEEGMKRDRKRRQRLGKKIAQRQSTELEKMKMKLKQGYTTKSLSGKNKRESETDNMKKDSFNKGYKKVDEKPSSSDGDSDSDLHAKRKEQEQLRPELKGKHMREKQMKSDQDVVRKSKTGLYDTEKDDVDKTKTYFTREILIETDESDAGKKTEERDFKDKSKDKTDEKQSYEEEKIDTSDIGTNDKLSGDSNLNEESDSENKMKEERKRRKEFTKLHIETDESADEEVFEVEREEIYFGSRKTSKGFVTVQKEGLKSGSETDEDKKSNEDITRGEKDTAREGESELGFTEDIKPSKDTIESTFTESDESDYDEQKGEKKWKMEFGGPEPESKTDEKNSNEHSRTSDTAKEGESESGFMEDIKPSKDTREGTFQESDESVHDEKKGEKKKWKREFGNIARESEKDEDKQEKNTAKEGESESGFMEDIKPSKDTREGTFQESDESDHDEKKGEKKKWKREFGNIARESEKDEDKKERNTAEEGESESGFMEDIKQSKDTREGTFQESDESDQDVKKGEEMKREKEFGGTESESKTDEDKQGNEDGRTNKKDTAKEGESERRFMEDIKPSKESREGTSPESDESNQDEEKGEKMKRKMEFGGTERESDGDDNGSEKGTPAVQGSFFITITYDEWKKIEPKEPCREHEKPKLRKGWTDMFSDKFNILIPGCVLSFKYHNVATLNRSKGDYFNSRAICKHEGCGTFKFIIRQKPIKGQNIIIRCIIEKNIIVHKFGNIKKRHLTGERRNKVKEELSQMKASTWHYTETGKMDTDAYISGNHSQCQTKEILRKVRSEWKLHEVLHQDQFSETAIVQKVLAEEDEESTHVKGYVQELSYDPIMVPLFTDQSLEVAKLSIQDGPGIFYIDATGSVVQNVNENKKLLYYAMVVPGKEKGDPPVPVLEFLSERQGSYFLVRPLLSFMASFKKHSPRHNQPNRVEMDFSWAIIHSILLALNNTSINSYLLYCCDIHNSTSPRTKLKYQKMTTIHICASHMLKAVRNQLKDKEKDKKMRELLLRSFALLQNCTTLEQTTALWKLFCTVYGSRFMSSDVTNAEDQLRQLVMTANLDGLDDELICQPTEDEMNAEIGKSSGIRKNSPFYIIYKRIMIDALNQASNAEGEENPLFHNVFLDLMVNNYLPLVCLWSGLMLSHNEDTYLTRDSNSTVENWMKIVKEDTLGKKKKLRMGLFIRQLHLVLKGRLREYKRANELKKRSKTKGREKPDTDEAEHAEETWKRTESQKRKPYFFTPPKKFPEPKRKAKSKPSLGKESKTKHITRAGITNRGQTCWIISSLQALASLKKWPLSGDDPILRLTNEIVVDLQTASEKISMNNLLQAIEDEIIDVHIGRQHDAAVFVENVISKAHEEGHGVATVLKSICQCTSCESSKTNWETLPVIPAEMPARQEVSTTTILQEVFKQEVLSGENKVHCDACNEKKIHRKHYELPIAESDLVTIQIKRYKTIGAHLVKNVAKTVVNRCDDEHVERKGYSYLSGKEVEENCYFLYYEHVEVPNPYIDSDMKADDVRESYILSILDDGDETDDDTQGSRVLAIHHNQRLTSADVRRLQNEMWLNDKIVNLYFKMIGQECPNVTVVDTYFYTAIIQKRNPEKFLKQEGIEKELILIPTVEHGHWILLVLDMKRGSIEIMDSASTRTNRGSTVRNFLDESGVITSTGFSVHDTRDLPQQDNMSDCGVFMCQYGACRAFGNTISFTSVNVALLVKQSKSASVTDEIRYTIANDIANDMHIKRRNGELFLMTMMIGKWFCGCVDQDSANNDNRGGSLWRG